MEKPILFSGPMVKAILEGRKWQARRVIQPQPKGIMTWHPAIERWSVERTGEIYKDKYGQPGDRLWVRETWAVVKSFDDLKPSEIPKGTARWPVVWYAVPEIAAASIKNTGAPVGKTRPGIFMPRWASRLTLEITAVRVERLQDITEKDAKAEGVIRHTTYHPRYGYRDGFCTLWDSVNLKRGFGWQSNPWVWVIEFAVQERR